MLGIRPLAAVHGGIRSAGGHAGPTKLARVQVLRLSWDTEKKEWFYLPPPDVPEKLDPSDVLHWTGMAQCWNTMCAYCHSTNLQKNFDVESLTYHTTFSEIDVSCEACHGPASIHVELANSKSLFWDRKRGYGLAKLKTVDTRPQIHTCAPCHSRRSVHAANFRPGDNFYDYFNNELLAENTYYADGQILDEDYVFGSFIQSKMYHKDIRCTDCHNPHTARLEAGRQQGLHVAATSMRPPSTTRRAPLPQVGLDRCLVRGMSHAGDHLHGGRSATRPQYSDSATRSECGVGDAQCLHALSPERREDLGRKAQPVEAIQRLDSRGARG